jgi:nitroreductase/NAD-dependent dihydropyrimidine dehydrogenase PreA subunit
LSLLTIDKSKCKQDGLCAAECPMQIIRFEGQGSYPEMIPNGEPMCVRCGHCVAVCPHGALDHAQVPQADCPPIDRALAVSEAQAVQFLRSRRSVRRFEDRPVEGDTLQRLIEIARYAPTSSNMQLVEWAVIHDRDRLHELSGQVIQWMRRIMEADPQCKAMPYLPMLVKAWDAGIDTVLRAAPCLVTAMAPPQDRNGMVNLTLGLSYLELAAPVYGLGTCWAGLLQGAMMSSPELKQLAGIPQDYPFHYPMMIGYSKTRYYRLPERKTPKIKWL